MLNSSGSTVQGTIRAKFPFNDDEAADALAKAISSDRGKPIRTPYTAKYKKDLVKDLEKALSGDYEEVVLALMETPTKYDAIQLNKAIKVTVTSFIALILLSEKAGWILVLQCF
ncbi:unnamed protein product [Gongylonema pulchrum]|uniref:Annexin n=1 Tax=Gongylonema pulchrum TaxID=637853 RepID=A0A183D763_9BILA|nr:unnamed protein product [Gongylonema pulchrum]